MRIEPIMRQHTDVLLQLVRDPSLIGEFEMLATPEACAEFFDDPFGCAAVRWLAWEGPVPVAFSLGFAIPAAQEHWAMLRIGVLASHRRRGIARALREHAFASLRSDPAAASIATVCTSHWEDNETAAAFAAQSRFVEERRYWRMQFTGDAVAPAWPARVSLEPFDHSEGRLMDWHTAYLLSFANHHRSAMSTLEQTRALADATGFRADGVALAYLDGICAGFCRCTVSGAHGDIALLGVVPGARGVGLGRALLRWGTAWLRGQGIAIPRLMVDGQNESALQLYRSEGWNVERTRIFRSRPLRDGG